MQERKNGIRRSSILTFRRRLIIFRQLFREESTAEQLIAIVNLHLNHDGYPDNPDSALKHDLDALKREYNCKIRMDRRSGFYQLHDVGDFALLDLTQESRDALHFLEINYSDDSVLAAFINIQNLLRQIKMLVPDYGKSAAKMPYLMRNPGKQVATLDKRTLNTVKKAIEIGRAHV